MTRTWDYRVIRRKQADGSDWLQIQEVCYHDGVPSSCSSDGLAPGGGNMNDIMVEINRFTAATNKPILNYDDFTKTV